MSQEDLNASRLHGTDTFIELEAATKNVTTVLEKSVLDYNGLLEKYLALKEMVENGATNAQLKDEREGPQGYALVLVDAHNQDFVSEYLGRKKKGGAAAAYALTHGALARHLHQHHPELAECVMSARAYGDYSLLAVKMTSIEGPSGQKQQMLEFFAQEFSSAGPWYDFVNISSLLSVRKKVASMFSWYLEDTRCQHIFLVAQEQPEYIEMLRKHSEHRNRVTLVSTGNLDSGLKDFGYPTIALASLDSEAEDIDITENDGEDQQNPTHDDVDHKSPKTTQSAGPYGYIENNRYVVRTPPKSDMKSYAWGPESNSYSVSPTVLPSRTGPGTIPINAAGQRIDRVLRKPSKKEWNAYYSRTKTQNLCSKFFLAGHCPAQPCRYDHSAIDDALLLVLQHRLLEIPCRLESACRDKDCIFGHVCIAKGCTGNKIQSCKFSAATHGVDMEVAESVKPDNSMKRANREKEARMPTTTDTESPKASVEIWPTMGNLIDI